MANQTITVLESDGTTETEVEVLGFGRQAAAASKSTAMSTEDKAVLDAVAASASVLDDWDESDRAKVNPIVGQAGVQGGSGAVSATTQRVVLATDVPIPAGTNLVGKVKTKFIVATASAMTRPANTTAYTANDAVSDNGTAGSVTAISLTVSDVNDDNISLDRCRIASTDTGVQGKAFRIWFYRSDPTASTGIVGGDNAAFSTKQGTFVGSMSGTFKTFSDGSVAVCVPDEGARIICKPTSGAMTVYALLQTLEAFTPSANSTTFTLTVEGFQGAA